MLTGCLSNCNKYDYDIQPLTNLRTFKTDTLNNEFFLKFVLTTSRYEQKEQVDIRVYIKDTGSLAYSDSTGTAKKCHVTEVGML